MYIIPIYILFIIITKHFSFLLNVILLQRRSNGPFFLTGYYNNYY